MVGDFNEVLFEGQVSPLLARMVNVFVGEPGVYII